MIGSHLSDKLLERGYKVTGFDNLKIGKRNNLLHSLKNRNFHFLKGDILDRSELTRAAKNADIIVHLAASKKIDEKGNASDTLKVNAEGICNVFETAKKNKTKIIFASTSDVYGTSKELPFREDGNLVVGSPTAKRWAYAVSKM